MTKEIRNISLKQMRAFAAVARAGSFTRAAEQLFMTQSALSASIRGLEAELELRLFDRTTRRLELTDIGAQLLSTVEQLLGDLDRMTTDLRDSHAIRRGRVRIGATPLLAATLLPAAIQSFQQAHPEVTVRITDDSTVQLMEGLESGDLDMVVATLDQRNAELQTVQMLADQMVLVCAEQHRFAQAKSITWHELRGERLIAMRNGSGLRTLLDQSFEEAGLDMDPAQEVNHVATAMAAVGAGMGIAVLPAYSVRYLALPGVCAVPLHAPTMLRHVSIATLRRRTPSAAVRAMQDHLLTFVRPTPNG